MTVLLDEQQKEYEKKNKTAPSGELYVGNVSSNVGNKAVSSTATKRTNTGADWGLEGDFGEDEGRYDQSSANAPLSSKETVNTSEGKVATATTPFSFGEFNPETVSASLLHTEGGNSASERNQPVTVFDQPIAEKRAELERLIDKREQDSRRLVLATGQAASGEGISFPIEEADRIVLEAIYREFEERADTYREERRRQVLAQPGGERKLESLTFDTEEDYRSEISILYDIATQSKYSSLPLIKAFLNNPNFQILAEAEQYRLKQKHELDFFSGFGLNLPANANENSSNALLEPPNNTATAVTPNITDTATTAQANGPRPAKRTNRISNGGIESAATVAAAVAATNNTDGAQKALQAFVDEAQLAPYSLPLSKLSQIKTVATRLQTQNPNTPTQLEVTLPILKVAYYVNQFLHEPLNKRARPVSQVLAKNIFVAVLLVVFILLTIVSSAFQPTSNGNSQVSSNKLLPDVIVQMVATPTPIATITTVAATSAANTNATTPTIVAATATPTPPAQLPSQIQDSHGNFSAPSTMQIPALSLSEPVGKAEVLQNGNQVTVLWPSGSNNKDHPAQYGAYPGEQGNMVVIGNWKALGEATQLQVNDLIQITNRTGTVYTYQVIPLGDNGEPQAIVGCGNHDFLAGQQISDNSNNGLITNKAVSAIANSDSYLTLVIPYVDDSQPQTTQQVATSSNGLVMNTTTVTSVVSPSAGAASTTNATNNLTPVKCTPLGQNFPAGTSPQTTGDPHYLVRVWRAKIVAVAPRPAPTIGTPVAIAPTPSLSPSPKLGATPTASNNQQGGR